MKSISMRRLIFAFTSLTAVFSPIALAQYWEPIAECVDYVYLRPHVHVVKTNLSCKAVQLNATEERHKGVTTSEFAKKTGNVVAINGDFFRVQFETKGLAIANGIKWRASEDSSDRSFFACSRDKICEIDPANHIAEQKPEWHLAVGGWGNYSNGRFACSQGIKGCDVRNSLLAHPRTAIGLDAKNRWLYMVVVEGRLPDYPGMTLDELSEVFNDLAIDKGLNLDGGGSSTLVIKGQRVNRLPSGQLEERAVANHLGIFVKQ